MWSTATLLSDMLAVNFGRKYEVIAYRTSKKFGDLRDLILSQRKSGNVIETDVWNSHSIQIM